MEYPSFFPLFSREVHLSLEVDFEVIGVLADIVQRRQKLAFICVHIQKDSTA